MCGPYRDWAPVFLSGDRVYSARFTRPCPHDVEHAQFNLRHDIRGSCYAAMQLPHCGQVSRRHRGQPGSPGPAVSRREAVR